MGIHFVCSVDLGQTASAAHRVLVAVLTRMPNVGDHGEIRQPHPAVRLPRSDYLKADCLS